MDIASDTTLSRSSSRSGFSKVFSGRRHHRKSDSVPVSGPGDADTGSLRSSVDEALGKLRERAASRTSGDSAREGLSGLFKRRSRHGQTEAAESDEGGTLGVSFHDLSPSEESLPLHKSIASSLLTEDSDSEA